MNLSFCVVLTDGQTTALQTAGEELEQFSTLASRARYQVPRFPSYHQLLKVRYAEYS